MSDVQAIHRGNQQGPAPERARVSRRAQESSAAPGSDAAWQLEPHICRACHSRLVSRPLDVGGRLYHCTNCGLEALGREASALCCCGMKIRRATQRHTSGYTQVDAGIRCVLNPDPSPDFPSLYVAMEVANSSSG